MVKVFAGQANFSTFLPEYDIITTTASSLAPHVEQPSA